MTANPTNAHDGSGYDVGKDVEEVLGFLPADDEDLLEAGLDSVRAMKLAARWDVSIMDLAEEPTLAAWRRLVASPA